jgi:DNA-binding NtrC family response regulator
MVDRAKVLVVDDEQDILDSLRTYLEGELAVDVVPASSGQEGLGILAAQRVDLILSDFRMPVMDGITFLRMAFEKWPTVPRILVTAYPDMHLAIRAANEAAVAHFVTKPVQPTRFREIVRATLDAGRRASQGRQAMDRAAGLGRKSAP